MDTGKSSERKSPAHGAKGTGSRARDAWLFFRTFLRHPSQVSSPMPSSPEITRTALADLPLDRASCILELGAGTGPITEGIVSRVNGHGTRVIAVEYEARFCRRLRDEFPGVEVVEADATDLDGLKQQLKLGQVDHVISALPLFAWPAKRRDEVTRDIARLLPPDGTFTQVTGLPLSFFRTHFRRHFEKVAFRPVLRSLPPGGVFRCSGYRD